MFKKLECRGALEFSDPKCQLQGEWSTEAGERSGRGGRATRVPSYPPRLGLGLSLSVVEVLRVRCDGAVVFVMKATGSHL